jgi:L-seryl-tRNA(Ser) seleniumtransferase
MPDGATPGGNRAGKHVKTASGLRPLLRDLPSVDELTRLLTPRLGQSDFSHPSLVRAARAALQEARDSLRASGRTPVDRAAIAERALVLLGESRRYLLRSVINATGVIVNTNLGRAPLAEAAIAHVSAVARGYSNLEYDLQAGTRGSRQAPVRALLRELAGAEDALVVNNNAAAVLVVLSALAAGREVIISRGELVEIGGGFRIPDVLRQSGARLVEVGTTNRTRARDYAAAVTEETALLLSVHPSNFRIVGFTESPSLSELATIAHGHALPLVHDLGSGCLEPGERWSLAHEPTPRESLASRADVVCFSGDKLLGGPQAGIIVGRHDLLAQIEHHPLMRALRCDKLTLAALEATLRLYAQGTATDDLPVWRAISMPLDAIQARAERWASLARGWGVPAEVVRGESTVGGGALPGETLPTWLCAIPALGDGAASDIPHAPDPAAIAERLRASDPPVVARVLRGQLLLDPRTVLPEEDDTLLDVLERTLRPADS